MTLWYRINKALFKFPGDIKENWGTAIEFIILNIILYGSFLGLGILAIETISVNMWFFICMFFTGCIAALVGMLALFKRREDKYFKKLTKVTKVFGYRIR